jgi:hypothetical protein
MKTDYIYKSHNRGQSIKHRFVQKYTNARKFIFIATDYKMSHSSYGHNFLYYIYIHFSLLRSWDKVTGLNWVEVQEGWRRCLRRMKRDAVKKSVYCSNLCKPNHLVTFAQHLLVQNQYTLCPASYPRAKAASCCHVAWQQGKHEMWCKFNQPPKYDLLDTISCAHRIFLLGGNLFLWGGGGRRRILRIRTAIENFLGTWKNVLSSI